VPEYRVSILVEGRESGMASAVGGAAGFLEKIGTIAAGILAADVFRKIADGILSIGRQAFEAAAMFQNLEIRLSGLIARELVAEGSTNDFVEALRMAGPLTGDMLDWVKTEAVFSPFTVKDIATVQSLGMAMGLTGQEAMDLTTATSNFSAGMGLSRLEMERIVYNMGQIIQQGKVAGTELRDLARGSFVPVTDVLKRMQSNLKMTNISLDDFRKKAAKGAYPVKEFIKAFEQLAMEQFPGAAQRMAMTWQGLTSNIADFVQVIIGAGLMGPIVDRLAAGGAAWLQAFMASDARASVEAFGATLSDVFGFLQVALQDNILPAFQTLWDALGIQVPTLAQIGTGLKEMAVGFIGLTTGLEPFVQQFIVPMIEGIRALVDEWGPKIMEFLGGIWTKIMEVVDAVMPYLMQTAAWFRETFMQVLFDVGNVIAINLAPAWEGLKSVLIPVGRFLATVLITLFLLLVEILKDLWEWIGPKIAPTIAKFLQWMADLKTSAQGIVDVINGWILALQNFITKLTGIKLPSWLEPGSPTPFEMGIRGITDAMKDMGKTPFLSNQLAWQRGNATNNTFNLSANYGQQEERALRDDVRLLSMMYGSA